MPPKKALQSPLTINLDDGEYWHIVMHSDATPEALLTTPPHGLTDAFKDVTTLLVMSLQRSYSVTFETDIPASRELA